MFRNPLFKVITGGGYYRSDINLDVNRDFGGFPPPFSPSHGNGYVYSYLGFPKNITWTLGLSVDLLNDELDSELKLSNFHQVNPKGGVIWNVTPDTTIRLAAFRTLKRALITDQTIEPTQIAGFNQYFDDHIGTDAKRYGAAIDHRFSPNIFVGTEVSKRDLERPGAIFDNEMLYRAYLNWTPSTNIAVTSHYEFDDFDQDISAPALPNAMRTHLASTSVKYFHQSGFFGSLGLSYVNQTKETSQFDIESNQFILSEGSDDFVLVDVGIGYRLPKRYGIFRLGIANLFDQQFDYLGLFPIRTSDIRAPPFLPERSIRAQITIAF